MFIRICNINVTNFEVYISDVSQDDGFNLYNIYDSGASEIDIDNIEFNKEYWIKIVNRLDNSYIIKNIKTHSENYYNAKCNS